METCLVPSRIPAVWQNPSQVWTMERFRSGPEELRLVPHTAAQDGPCYPGWTLLPSLSSAGLVAPSLQMASLESSPPYLHCQWGGMDGWVHLEGVCSFSVKLLSPMKETVHSEDSSYCDLPWQGQLVCKVLGRDNRHQLWTAGPQLVRMESVWQMKQEKNGIWGCCWNVWYSEKAKWYF